MISFNAVWSWISRPSSISQSVVIGSIKVSNHLREMRTWYIRLGGSFDRSQCLLLRFSDL